MSGDVFGSCVGSCLRYPPVCVSTTALVLVSCRSASLGHCALYPAGCIMAAAGGERGGGGRLFKGVILSDLFFSLIANQYVQTLFFFLFFFG